MNYESPVAAERGAPASQDFDYDREPRPRSGKIVYILIALAIIGALVAAYLLTRGGEGAAAAADTEKSQLAVITVTKPGLTTIQGEIEATGTLAARRQLPVGVAGEGGRVVSVPVDAGDWVRQGQVLVAIDRSVQQQQISSSRAQIDVARADAQLAQANLDRALKLVERGFISQADIDRLTATRDAANARVAVARAQVRELEARNARLNVYAPASGLVLERRVEPGQVVSAGSGALFTIARGGEMEMLAEVGEAQLGKLAPGVSASVVPVGSDKVFSGQVWQIAPTINENDRQGIARIALPYAPELRPGGFATAKVASGTVSAPLLPESAILSDSEGSFVYIVDAENKVRRRAVTTGLVVQEGIAVIGGLTGNESVVLRAGGFLNEGEAVEPKMAEKTKG